MNINALAPNLLHRSNIFVKWPQPGVRRAVGTPLVRIDSIPKAR